MKIELLVDWFDGLKAEQIYKPGEFLNTKRGEIVVITKRGEI